MAAESGPERVQYGSTGVRLLRPEPCEQGGCDDIRGDLVVHGGLDGPSSLAGIADRPFAAGQIGILREFVAEELEQQRLDDRALLPARDDLGGISHHIAGGVQQLPALGVGFHEGILDAVMDHLGEVSGTGFAGVHEAVGPLWFESLKQGHEVADGLVAASDHEGVAPLEAQDAATDAGIDEVNTPRPEPGGTRLRLPEVLVATVDDDVPRAQTPPQHLEDVHRRFTGGDHHPDDPRLGEQLDHDCDRSHPRTLRILVVHENLVPRTAETLSHRSAHLALTDHTDLQR